MLDRHGHARVTDFGIAACNDNTAGLKGLTLAGTPIGTFGYVAPEQHQDARAAGSQADIYSLGVVLYELLSGVLPLGAYEPLSQLVPGLPSAWDRLIARSL